MAKGKQVILYMLGLGVERELVCKLPLARWSHKGYQLSGGTLSLRQFVRQPDAEFMEPVDRRILMRLHMHQSYRSPDVRLYDQEGFNLIKEMTATGRCLWEDGNGKPLKWSKPRSGKLKWMIELNGDHRPVLKLSPPTGIILPTSPPLYVEPKENRCGPIESEWPDELLGLWVKQAPMPSEESSRFYQNLVQRFPSTEIPLPGQLKTETVKNEVPIPCLHVFRERFEPKHSAELNARPQTLEAVRLNFDYGGRTIAWAEPAQFINVLASDQLLRQVQRHCEAEAEFAGRLEKLGLIPLENLLPEYVVENRRGDFGLDTAQGNSWWELLQSELPNLQREGWHVTFDPGARLVVIPQEAWYAELQPAGPGRQWFDFETGFEIDGQKVNLLPVVHQFLSANRDLALDQLEQHLTVRTVTVPLSDGRQGVIPGSRFFAVIRNLFELFNQPESTQAERVRLNRWKVAEILDLESIYPTSWGELPQVRQLADKLRKGVQIQPIDPPAGLQAELRGYQKFGLAWLQFLREHEMDGILADDMGLGKTVQTLAHLLQEKQAGRLAYPSLIIAPTSLMKNWTDETRRFTPDLSLLCLQGPDRSRHFKGLNQYDLALTTYPLLRRDSEFYSRHQFAYVILDEAQYIKNQKAQVAQIVYQLQCQRRLCLTGTPMENHLGELWSLFHFLMPGFLGDESTFRRRFRNPIEKNGSTDLRRILAKRVSPFLLRRKKEEVEQELPPKTEMIQSVPLSERQRDLYESVRLAMESRIREVIEEKGLARSHIIILDALLKLRQICCDPRLMEKETGQSTGEDSSKLEALMEMLPEMIEEGRRILLFSQFTSMLALIEDELNRQEIAYAKLTGQTQDRSTPIEHFQNGRVPLFLISLKAGGTGLNLTAADTVIHYDPWWNPAVENQATDRAHRIGQQKRVFVYKLITEGTVEAKIMKLQKQKAELVAGILSESFPEKLQFDETDLEILLSKVE